MAISPSNVVFNHRAITCQITGDGSTTSFSLPHNIITRPGMTCSVIAYSSPTMPFQRGSNAGGLLFPTGGTGVSCSGTHAQNTATTGTNGTVTVTFGSAPGNGTVVYVAVIFTQYTN